MTLHLGPGTTLRLDLYMTWLEEENFLHFGVLTIVCDHWTTWTVTARKSLASHILRCSGSLVTVGSTSDVNARQPGRPLVRDMPLVPDDMSYRRGRTSVRVVLPWNLSLYWTRRTLDYRVVCFSYLGTLSVRRGSSLVCCPFPVTCFPSWLLSKHTMLTSDACFGHAMMVIL